MNIGLFREIIACPVCGAHLVINEADIQVFCSDCNTIYRKGKHIWNFIPVDIVDWKSPIWQAWQHLQQNGIVSYQADPEHNLSVVEREDVKQFAKFCNYKGLVLDIGCGPQAWPTYLQRGLATYVGIDPLLEDVPGEFIKIKALGEFLPFRANVFDHVLFSTTLDHFVDPSIALKAAARVCNHNGEIDIWLGEKHPDAPRPIISPEWYISLQKPDLAEDLFHIKRLNRDEFLELIWKTDLMVVDMESHPVDNFRVNHFYRLKPKA